MGLRWFISVMKKFINVVEDVVVDFLCGVVVVYLYCLKVDFDYCIVLCVSCLVNGKVGLVFGGGFGYELLYLGYVGWGMFDVVCCGEVFIFFVFD